MAYNNPRLWARVSVTNVPFHPRYLSGSILCTDLDQLRLVLSCSRSCPLQVELSFQFDVFTKSNKYSSSASLMRGPQCWST
jgi:hypothetical protein